MKVRDKKPNDDLTQLREAWGDTGDDEGESNFDKLQDGKNLRNILPAKDPEDRFFQMFAVHYGMGPDKTGSFRCTEPKGPFGHNKKLDAERQYRAKVCLACKIYCKNKTAARGMPFGTPESKKYWSERVAPWRARYQYLMATSKPKSKEEPDKVFILRCGQQIGKTLVEIYYDSDAPVRFTNPLKASMIKITKRKLSKEPTDVEYDVRVLPVRKKIRFWKKLKKQLPDLKAMLPTALDEESQQAILDGDGNVDDGHDSGKKKKKRKHREDIDDRDLDEVENDDDDEDGDSKPQGKLGRRKKRKDEEVDPDAPEEDDDAPKKKSKKSKMRDRLARRAGREV